MALRSSASRASTRAFIAVCASLTSALLLAGSALAESIVYTKSPTGYSGLELWRASSDGSAQMQLSTGGTTGIEHPVLSPDGRQVAFTSSDGGLFTINIDGTNKRNVVPRPDLGTWWERPSWSPSGSQIYLGKHEQKLNAQGTAYVDKWSIYRVNADGTGLIQIVAWNGPSGPVQSDPTLSRNGTKLAFSSSVTPSGASTNGQTVWTTNADGSNPRQVTPTPTVSETVNTDQTPHYAHSLRPAFSPSGSEITYTREVWYQSLGFYSYDLFTIPSSGGSPIQDTSTGETNENNAAYSSTGVIAYDAGNAYTGGREIRTLNVGGGDSSLISGSTSSFDQPSYGTTAVLTDAQLLAAFSPTLKYDTAETYRADAPNILPESYVPGKNGRSNYLKNTSGTILAAADPALRYADLNLAYLGSSYPGGRVAASTDLIDEVTTSTTQYAADGQRLHGVAAYANRTSARVIPYVDGTKVLQYWFFYYYNPKTYLTRGAHEGDWEMVQIHVGSDQKPIEAMYSQHDNGERCDWVHVPRTDSGHPVVYVAEGSHANYLSSGYHLNSGANDNSNGQGEVVTPSLINITTPPSWALWPGHWGGTPGAFAGAESPTGPKFQGNKWSDPLAWGAGIDGCTEGQTFPKRAAGRPRHVRPRSAPATPPLPRVRTRERGSLIVVDYEFATRPQARLRRPWMMLTTIDARGHRYPPLTARTRIRGHSGRIVQPRGLGKGPFTLRVSVLSRGGTRSTERAIRLR